MINKISKEEISSKINEIRKIEFDKETGKLFLVFSDYSISYTEFRESNLLNSLLEETELTSITCSNQATLQMDTQGPMKGLISLWQHCELVFRLEFDNGKFLIITTKDANLD